MSGSTTGGGGRGGEVRLKLYLSFVWVAAKSPHTTVRPARAWATLLGLDDPDVKGTRRVQKAIDDLEQFRFIEVEQRPGHAPEITLLSELGDGEPYTSPADAYSALSANGAPFEDLVPHAYTKYPSAIWTSGLITELSAAALAMLLALRAAAGGKKSVWITPALFDEHYGLSKSTQTKGIAELRKAKLISSKSRPVNEEGLFFIGEKRVRKVHTFRPYPS